MIEEKFVSVSSSRTPITLGEIPITHGLSLHIAIFLFCGATEN